MPNNDKLIIESLIVLAKFLIEGPGSSDMEFEFGFVEKSSQLRIK